MTLHTPNFLQSAGGDADLTYSGLELRNFIRSMIGVHQGFQPAQGVIGGTNNAPGFKVTQRGAGANFSVDVPSGRALITDDDVTNGGTAHCWNDATVNVTTPSAPGSGTQVHRVVLQLENHLENGAYGAGVYNFTPLVLADTGSGTPAEPNSAITLAFVSIAAGQASVQNANITDYREQAGSVFATKAGDTGRTTNTVQSSDPDLQLLQLAANATYDLYGAIFFNGPGSFNGNDGIKCSWAVTSAAMLYVVEHMNLSGTATQPAAQVASDTVTAGTNGTGNPMALQIAGTITTTAAPASALFKWAQNNSSGTTTVMAKSWLRANRQS